MKILLVEDDETNYDMLSRRLIRVGFDVIGASDGIEGINKAQQGNPDIILMDISLPVMDGFEATRILKKDPALKNIPVIALTAHAMTKDRVDAINAGCNDYDTKPVDFQRLLTKISALTEKSRGI
ncbi:MAG: response regulator [Nitrospirae bacterium]|nr:response regulator [Nitrospirota bacterium]MBF0535621.1 response regulator [Nitrospirota bacterium]MBF0616927.1 response regulator [Nitrospirota bacterium]